MAIEEEKPHQRRVRYSGTHPKKYNEKYKELQADKYKDDVLKIIQKGKTPAGMHISICVNEILDILQIKPGQTGLDATLGYGGHTKRMLECLDGQGHLYCLDADPVESKKTEDRLRRLGFDSNILTIINENFADIDKVFQTGQKFDFVLADLGLSSMQIDNPERGFTFKQDGPLDLRLNQSQGISGAQLLEQLSQKELESLLIDNSDEPYAKQIAQTITSQKRRGLKITTTKQLADIVEKSLEGVKKNEEPDFLKKSCQRVFQALRIDVNKELNSLAQMLDKLPCLLNSGGRVAILSFHSGEDRLVKKSFKCGCKDGVYCEVARDIIRPSLDECSKNPRAHSAKLRWAIKA